MPESEEHAERRRHWRELRWSPVTYVLALVVLAIVFTSDLTRSSGDLHLFDRLPVAVAALPSAVVVFGVPITRLLRKSAVLLLVHTIVQYPPTSVDGEVHVWGPHSDALDPCEWRLTVVEGEAGERLTWQLDGRDKTTTGSEFVTVISGEAFPGDEPHRGTGSFAIDFDAAAIANPVEHRGERGLVSVEYGGPETRRSRTCRRPRSPSIRCSTCESRAQLSTPSSHPEALQATSSRRPLSRLPPPRRFPD